METRLHIGNFIILHVPTSRTERKENQNFAFIQPGMYNSLVHMSEREDSIKALVPAASKELLKKPTILKRDIGVLTIWLGSHSDISNDLDAFELQLEYGRKFGVYPAFVFEKARELTGDPYPAMLKMDIHLRKVLAKIKEPLAIFNIISGDVAERDWILALRPGLMEVRRQQRRDGSTFVYNIILGAGFSKEGEEDTNGHFSRYAMRAKELGGLYLPYDGDYPTVSTSRLIEFMNRTLGHDLPGKEFPNYTQTDLMKIAWHISKEDFNLHFPREGAIPKYPIINGKPQFLF